MRDAGLFIDTLDTPVKRRGVWTTYFPDMSNNNGPVNYQEIAHNSRRTGITGVEHKATEGDWFVDGLVQHAREECDRFGLRLMLYHFARPDRNNGAAGAIREAAFFCNVVGKIKAGDWRPMLDFETPPFAAGWVEAWNTEVKRRLGVAPVLYSYWSALVGMHLPKPLSDGLILAYPNGLPRVAPSPKPWKRWQAHQYSWHGHICGVNGAVDLNWTPSVRSLLAHPVQGAALEPLYAAYRRRA